MEFLSVYNVGDGMCLGLFTKDFRYLMIDCGGKPRDLAKNVFSERANYIDALIISHFHHDHYNGIIENNNVINTSFNKLYIPIVPKFPSNSEFMKCLFAMNSFILGQGNTHIYVDFIYRINALNTKPLRPKYLYKGKMFTCYKEKFKVLWPPSEMLAVSFTKSVKRAIKDFENAYNKCDALKEIYDLINDYEIEMHISGEFEHLNNKKISISKEFNYEKYNSNKFDEELNSIIKKSNDSLRNAANRISLVLKIKNDFIFLGDLMKREIKDVTKNILTKHFQVMINPHHGTHWHDNIKDINCDSSISSVGNVLINKVRPEYTTYFENNHLSTKNINHNIYLSSDIIKAYQEGYDEFIIKDIEEDTMFALREREIKKKSYINKKNEISIDDKIEDVW